MYRIETKLFSKNLGNLFYHGYVCVSDENNFNLITQTDVFGLYINLVKSRIKNIINDKNKNGSIEIPNVLQSSMPYILEFKKHVSGPDCFGKQYKNRNLLAKAVGRKKTAVACVWISNGEGDVYVNRVPLNVWTKEHQTKICLIENFLKSIVVEKKYDIHCRVKGGGCSSQVIAILNGISRAIVDCESTLKGQVKELGYFTVDSRRVERKKPGRKKARKSPQFSKR